MRNLEPLIAEINFILDSVDVPPKGQLQRIADWYSDEVKFLNATVDKVSQQFTAGERSKAFQQLSGGDQNLCDSVTILNFDRRNDWIEFTNSQGIGPPPDISLEKFRSLGKWLEELEPIESLLERYRILILAEAPAFSRHAILRLLSRRDPTNKAWLDDIRQLEEHRLKELPGEIEQAKKEFDRERLLQLATEVSMTQWDHAVSTELQQFVVQSKAKDFATGIEFELNALSKKLLLAFENRNWIEANEIKKQWDTVYKKSTEKSKEAMSQEMNDVLGWINQKHDATNGDPADTNPAGTNAATNGSVQATRENGNPQQRPAKVIVWTIAFVVSAICVSTILIWLLN